MISISLADRSSAISKPEPAPVAKPDSEEIPDQARTTTETEDKLFAMIENNSIEGVKNKLETGEFEVNKVDEVILKFIRIHPVDI